MRRQDFKDLGDLAEDPKGFRAWSRLAGVLLAAALVVLAAPQARAVTDEEIFRDFRFNFINPGARSLGMGGAFISIANDATAARANPAGLTNLLEPQLFSEIRLSDTDSSQTERSFRDPFLSGEGFDVAVGTTPQNQIAPTFVSYVHPLGKVSLGVSRQEVINTRNRTANTYEFLFATGGDTRTGEGEVELRLTSYNLSVGWLVHDSFRLGGTVSFETLELQSNIVNTYTDPTGAIIGNPALAGTPVEMYRTRSDDSDASLSWAVGALWKIVPTVSLGVVMRAGGDFEMRQTLIGSAVDPSIVPGQIAGSVFFNEAGTLLTLGNDTYDFNNRFHIPDQTGLGVSWNPIAPLTVAVDVVRIQYEDLLEDFNSRLNVLTFGFQEEELAAFTVDDQTNLHLGVEYLFQGSKGRTWAFRGGWHQDKDNRIRSDFAPGGFGLGSNDNFPGRDDESHISAGLGVVLNERFQVDTALDISDATREFVTSIVYSF